MYLREKLIGALIGLARATDGNEHLISASSTEVVVEALDAVRSGADEETMLRLLARTDEEKRKMVPNCFVCEAPCGRTSEYDMQCLLKADEKVRFLKNIILSGICDAAAKFRCDAAQYGRDAESERFFYKALIVTGIDEFCAEDLLPVAAELAEINAKQQPFGSGRDDIKAFIIAPECSEENLKWLSDQLKDKAVIIS